MPTKYFPVSDHEKKALFTDVSDHMPAGYKDPSYCSVMSGTPGFYPEWTLYEIQKQEDVTSKPITLLKKDNVVKVLDWQAKTVLEFNKAAPLILSIHEIAPYVRFYFSHVRGRDGMMQVISSYDDFKWREEPAPQVKKALSSLIRPPHLISWDDTHHDYEVGAHILFQNNLFECKLHVNRHGEVDVQERTLQVENMPLLDSVVE